MKMKIATSSVGLRQKAVYWPTPKADGEGTYSFGASSEINCHWDDTAETFLDAIARVGPRALVGLEGKRGEPGPAYCRE